MPDPMARSSKEFADAPLFAPQPAMPSAQPELKKRHPMSERSLEANRRRMGKLREDHLAILRVLAERGDCTFDRVCELLGWPSTKSGRATELNDLAFIERSGQRNRTRGGSLADVWRITRLGVAQTERAR